MHFYFKLEGRNPIPCKREEVSWTKDRFIKKTNLYFYWVSTVFVPINMGLNEEEPLVFETMVFGRKDFNDRYCARYFTYEKAIAGHYYAVLWTIGYILGVVK